MAVVQWYPGHMNKAKNEIEAKLKLVDIIIEVVDARAPYSSLNPIFNVIGQNKPRMVIMTKTDLADQKQVILWQKYFREVMNIESLAVNLNQFTHYSKIVSMSKEVLKAKFAKEQARGLKPRAIRAMIIGVPNVGKSTLINRLAKKNVTKAANTPGVTKSQQWIRYNKEFELLDTPGVLWPKFEDERIGYKLALISAIKDTLIPHQEVAFFMLQHFSEYYPALLSNELGLTTTNITLENLNTICSELVLKHHLKVQNGQNETAYRFLIQSFKNNAFGPLSLDICDGKLYE